MARYMRTDLGRGHSRISPPAVVGAGIYYRGIQQYLTAVDRMAEQPRHFARYNLAPPAVVGAGVAFHGPGTLLTRHVRSLTGTAKSRLSPPTVVDVIREVYYGPAVTLAPSRRGQAKSRLFPAAQADSFQGPTVWLTRNKPQPTARRLQPPAVVFLAVELTGPEVHLARITPPPTVSKLSPPAVVSAPAVFFGPDVTLTRITPAPTGAKLAPPAVVSPVLFFGPGVTLAPQARGVTSSVLRPPAQADAFFGPQVTLAKNFPPPTKSVLQPPTVVNQPAVIDYAITTSLAPSSHGQAKSRLSPPAVVAPVLFFGPETALARITPAPTSSRLQPPTVVFTAVELSGPTVSLTRNKVPLSNALLRPPAVVNQPPAILYGVKVTLAYSRRGKPKSQLRPPAVTGAGRAFAGPGVLLAYSRRGRPRPSLFPPAVVGRRPFRGILINLAVPKRGRAAYVTQVNSFLRPPPFRGRPFRGIQVYLAIPKRGRAAYVTQFNSFLRPPPVVGRRPHRGILVTLVAVPRRAQQPQRFARWKLFPPVVEQPPPVVAEPLRVGGRRPNYRYPGVYDEEFEDLLALILASFYDSDEEED